MLGGGVMMAPVAVRGRDLRALVAIVSEDHQRHGRQDHGGTQRDQDGTDDQFRGVDERLCGGGEDRQTGDHGHRSPQARAVWPRQQDGLHISSQYPSLIS